MKTKTLLASLALASLVVAQPASAATRSADSLPQTSAQPATSADRAGSIVGESEELGRPIIWIIALAAIIGVIIIATSDSDSPG
jgi:hypothetical protein